MVRAGFMLLIVGAGLAACPSKPPSSNGGGSGSGGGSGAGACEGLRDKVLALYRAEAQAKEPERVDEATADNTAMVLGECAKNPGRVQPCLTNAPSVEIIERTCLAPLDDEGSEGEALRK